MSHHTMSSGAGTSGLASGKAELSPYSTRDYLLHHERWWWLAKGRPLQRWKFLDRRLPPDSSRPQPRARKIQQAPTQTGYSREARLVHAILWIPWNRKLEEKSCWYDHNSSGKPLRVDSTISFSRRTRRNCRTRITRALSRTSRTTYRHINGRCMDLL